MKILRHHPVDRGGQGVAWKGEIEGTGEPVAVKVLTLEPGLPEAEARRRFLREVTCQALLVHPNIVPILAQDSSDDPPWFCMPWADSTLRTELEANPTGISESRVQTVFRSILEAVDYAHEEGVLHRDLKPENVLMIGDVPHVADFGLSRRLNSQSTTLTSTNIGMGTYAYSAPEQFADAHSADARADIYSLGKLLYELLSGRLPFPSIDTSLIPQKYVYLVQKATNERADRRYATVRELAHDFELLAFGSEDLMPATGRARTLVDQVSAGTKGAAENLLRLLLENGEDLDLYTSVVPDLSVSVLAKMAAGSDQVLKEIFARFDRYAEGSHPYSYTDRIADFLARMYSVAKDYGLKSAILSRILVVGSDHNRFHVGDVFLKLVEDDLNDRAAVLMVAEVIRAHPLEIPFVESGLREMSLPPSVADALDLVSPPG